MKQKIIAAIAILLVIIGALVLWKHRAARFDYPLPTAGTNVIVFGDSLAAGQGASTGHDLASLLGQKLNVPVINSGVNGDTTASAYDRIVTGVLIRDPKVVIILLGGNDFFQNIPAKDTADRMGSIIDTIQPTGAGIILVNEDKLFASTPLYKQLAAKKHIPYIPDVMGGIINHKELMSDTIHPNDDGYAVMESKIEPVLRAYLGQK